MSRSISMRGCSLREGRRSIAKTESARTDEAELALMAWRARVLRVAAAQRSQVRTRFSITESGWLKDLVALSIYPDGPLRAGRNAAEQGDSAGD